MAMNLKQDESIKQILSADDDGDDDDDDNPMVPENEDEVERSHLASGVGYCTYAVTGPVTSFQSIFICHDCFQAESVNGGDAASTSSAPLCICQACADICHGSQGHDVEYVGMGPCYCDCDHIGQCSIAKKSQVQAQKLLGPHAPPSKREDICQAETSTTSAEPTEKTCPLQEVFGIPSLQNTAISAALVEHAQELIRHSKETFWIDKVAAAASHKGENPFCSLELLAWNVFQHHIEHYESLSDFDGGAEWWIQVKNPSSSSGQDGAVDLHYDKDEALAEVFGLGSFPTLSTVTYLSEPSSSQPFNSTIVLDHRYTQGEDEMIGTMLVSTPSLGKHLVFDGKLLHGAPAHHELRFLPKQSAATQDVITENGDSRLNTSDVRVTFLVNIWKQKPAKVQPLPNEIRDFLLRKALPVLQSLKRDQIAMVKKEIPTITLENDGDLPEHLRHRIELPFVSKGATWEDQLLNKDYRKDDDMKSNAESDEDDDSGGGDGLVVVTFPPPPSIGSTDGTVIVKFGPGLQAYLDYPQRELISKDQKKSKQYETGYV